MKHKLDYKLFWNWDHSMEWQLNTIGTQNCGVANPYTKRTEDFIADFTLAINWASQHGIQAIGCVGLLRDIHGGWESARRICGYAREHGVRIYLIAGLYNYGGIYYEGDSPISLDHFLNHHPECMARGINDVPLFTQFKYPYGCQKQPAGCPSNPTLHNFILDSLEYVFKAIPELGGIQIETGDSAVCHCQACRERRNNLKSDENRNESFSLGDMVSIYPEAVSVIRNISNDPWIICEMYTNFFSNPIFSQVDNPSVKALLKMPNDIFLQWGERNLRSKIWETSRNLPVPLHQFRNIMRAHHGTQWDGGRNSIAVENIKRQCEWSLKAGIQGVSIFGESSPFHTNSEFNYLALQYFADNPLHSTETFAENIMAPLLGGKKEWAEMYLNFSKLNQHPAEIPNAQIQIHKIINSINSPDARRRWYWLANYLSSFYYNFQTKER